MTDVTEFILDPALLEKYGIIRQSRAGWTGISTSLARLDGLEKTRDPYNEMETDRDDVLVYAQTVRRCADSIAYAVALAVHLSRHASAETPQQRMTHGFDAMCAGLGLRQRDEDDTRMALKRCIGGLVKPLPLDNWSRDGQLDETWTAEVQKLIDAVNSAPPPRDIVAPAWDAWMSRLVTAIQGGSDDGADLDYLRCRAAGALAGTILPVNLLGLTINELSGAYVKGIAAGRPDTDAPAPLWFAYGMLALLGFDTGRELVATVTPAYGDREKEQTSVFLQRLPASTSPRKGVLVVRSQVESLTGGWMPLRNLPALSVSFDEYVSSARVEMRPYLASRLHGILLEVDATDAVAEVTKRTSQLAASLPNIPIALLSRMPRTDIQGFTRVVAPKDLSTAAGLAFPVTA
jgi:hypothetical protein